jgi:hypothetical protein
MVGTGAVMARAAIAGINPKERGAANVSPPPGFGTLAD